MQQRRPRKRDPKHGEYHRNTQCQLSGFARKTSRCSLTDMANLPSELCHDLGLEAQFELAMKRSTVLSYFTPIPEIEDSMNWYEWVSSYDRTDDRFAAMLDPKEDWRIYSAAKRALHAAASLESRYGLRRNTIQCRYLGLASTGGADADALAPFVTTTIGDRLKFRRPTKSKQLVFEWTMSLGKRAFKERATMDVEVALQWPSLPSAYSNRAWEALVKLDWRCDEDVEEKARQVWPDIIHSPAHHHYGSCVPVPAGWDAFLRQHCSKTIDLEHQLEAVAQEAEAHFEKIAKLPDDWRCACQYLGLQVGGDGYEKDPLHWPTEDVDLTRRIVSFRWKLQAPGRDAVCDVISRRCLDVLQRGLPKPPAMLTLFAAWPTTREQVEEHSRRQALQYCPEFDTEVNFTSLYGVSCEILGLPWQRGLEADRNTSKHRPGDVVNIAGVEHVLAARIDDYVKHRCSTSTWKAWRATDMWQKAATGNLNADDYLEVNVVDEVQTPNKKRLRLQATSMLRGRVAAHPYETSVLICVANFFVQLDRVRSQSCKERKRKIWQEVRRCFDKDLMAWGANPDIRDMKVWVMWRLRTSASEKIQCFLTAVTLDILLRKRSVAVPTALRAALSMKAEHDGDMPRGRPRSQAAAAAAKIKAQRLRQFPRSPVLAAANSDSRPNEECKAKPVVTALCFRCGAPELVELSDDDMVDSEGQPINVVKMYVMCEDCSLG